MWYVYMLVSIKDPNFTYIGKTISIKNIILALDMYLYNHYTSNLILYLHTYVGLIQKMMMIIH